MKRYPIIVFALIFALSVVISDYVEIKQHAYVFLTTFAFLILYYFSEKRISARQKLKNSLLLLSIFTLSFSVNNYRLHNENKSFTDRNSIRELFVKSLIYNNDKYQSFISEDISTGENFYTELSADEKLNLGDCIVAEVKYSQVEKGLAIPYEFNYNEYLRRKKIYRKLRIESHQITKKKAPLDIRIQSYINRKVKNSGLNENSKALVLALSMGDKSNLDKAMKEDFKKAGLMHLLALSGLHIGILSFSLLFILALIFRNRHNSTPNIIVLLFLFFYSYISGFSPSILRASIMFGVIIISRISKRKTNIYNSLAIAALILLLIDPGNFFEIGFQLSFAAVLAIVSVFPLLKKLYYPQKKISRYFYDIILVSISAQIGTSALSIYYFHAFPSAFLFSNLIEIPLFTVVLFLSYIEIAVLSAGFDVAVLNTIYDFLTDSIVSISGIIASFDFLYIENILLKRYALVFILSISISLIVALKKNNIKLYYIPLILLVLNQIVSIADKKMSYNFRQLSIAKNDIIIRNKSHYNCYKKTAGTAVFGKTVLMESLESVKTEFPKYFNFSNNYYVILDSLNITNKLSSEKHFLIVCDKLNINPVEQINKNTMAVIFNTRDRTMKRRWKISAEHREIPFFSALDSLYHDE